ncbi:flagellar biosynthetic protein FliO [Bradyrhizobium sp.]|uniref:flagellar biosynthetic protein FliO n=1 Tax=Bradyrhizobium sp. TaxID=376 RepID=UPI003C751505
MQALTFFFAFVAVLALIGVAAWLVRRFASNRLGANTNRSRMPRLAVIDAAAVDGRRRLVLVRRDNIEHLLMIGGPTDIVVESNIVRAMPGRDQLPQRPAVGSPEPQARIAPLPDAGGWGDIESPRAEAFDHAEPQMPEPPPRAARPSFADEMRRPAAPERRIDRDPLTGFAPEPMGGRPEPRPELRGEPMPSRVTSRNEPPLMPRAPRPSEAPKPPPIRAPERAVAPPPPPAPPVSSADQNLAEMAQRLEAALRRPAGDTVAPPVAPEPPPGRAASRNEPPMAPPVAAPSTKSGFENLEDEMASLLGRPKNPS